MLSSREDYTLSQNGPRTPTAEGEDGGDVANPDEHTDGFSVSKLLSPIWADSPLIYFASRHPSY